MKPQQYAEHKLLIDILSNTFPPGSKLPNERDLAAQIGITRPTLREALQRLAREKWLIISHGKQTIVNDYWNNGGLGILATMAKYAEFLPIQFIPDLLDFRIDLLVACAKGAIQNAPEKILSSLVKAGQLGDDAIAFTQFDWSLQLLMANLSNNMIYPLILNDFSESYKQLGNIYFKFKEARENSLKYYSDLEKDIQTGGENLEKIVRKVMQDSRHIWSEIQPGME